MGPFFGDLKKLNKHTHTHTHTHPERTSRERERERLMIRNETNDDALLRFRERRGEEEEMRG
jgi:hypothetical protein